MKDELAYSPVVGKAVIAAFNATAAAFGDFFPEGSADPARSDASPKIWEDTAGFQAELAKFQTERRPRRQASGTRRPGRPGGLQPRRSSRCSAPARPATRPSALEELTPLRAPLAWPGASLAARAGAAALWVADRAARRCRRPSSRRCPRATRRAARPVLGRRLRLLPRRRAAPRATSGCGSAAAGRSRRRFGDFVGARTSRPTRPTASAAGPPADFANAMLRGVSPDGRHYYPAFPYTSYARMPPQDVADLWAYPATLPPVAGRRAGHELGFPFGFRRGIGLWKLAFLDAAPAVAIDTADPLRRPRPVPRRGAGPLRRVPHPAQLRRRRSTARAGSPAAPTPKGRAASRTSPRAATSADWSPADIAYFLETGFTPDFDSVGGAWPTSSATWRCSPPATATPSPPISRRSRRCP